MKKYYVFVMFAIMVNMAFGQLEMIPPSSPESTGLLRSLNISVNKGTGTAGVSIPLYSIESGNNIKIPITLSYNCSAIKVQDMASWVGLGWNLSAGGKITRVIVDQDDLVNGYCKGSGILANNFTSWWNGANLARDRVDYCTSTTNCTGCLTFDGEPDLYYYEIPGKTGMFTIDKDGLAWPIPYTPINIVLDDNLNFTITDEFGVKYTLDLKESTTVTKYNEVKHNGNNSTIKTHISTWHLTKIKNTTGNEITFSYTSGGEINYSNYNYKQRSNGSMIDKSINFRSSPYYLSQITWNTEKLEFLSSANRADLANAKRLDEIKIYSCGNYLKSIKFIFSNFAPTVSYKRLKLDEIYEANGSNRLTLNKFVYNTSVNLPDRNSKDFDHWGFYNGKSNSSYFPTDNGSERSPSFPHTTANILTRVYNNLGGYIDYEYEQNKLVNGAIVGGVRIKNIKKYDNEGNSYTTNYSYAEGLGVVAYDNSNYNDNWHPGEKFCYLHDDKNTNVYYSTVSETLPNGSKIVSSYTSIYDGHDEASKRHINSNESEGIDNDAPIVFPNSSRFWRRGLLKEEIQYNSVGQEIKRTKYKYEFKTHIRKEIKGYFVFEYNMPTGALLSNLIVYDWLSEPIYVDTVLVTGRYVPNTITKYSYDPTYYLPTEERVTYLNNGDTYLLKIKYPFSYTSKSNPSGTVESNSLDDMLLRGMIALPIEKIKIKNNRIIEGKLSLYRKNGDLPVLAKVKTLQATPIEVGGFTESEINYSKNFYHDLRYSMVENCDHYDNKLNLISSHIDNCQPQSVIYGYNHSLPVAVITNAVYSCETNVRENQVFYTSFEDFPDAISLYSAKTGDKVYSKSYTINLGNFKPGTYILSYWKNLQNNWTLVEEELAISPSTTNYTINSSADQIDEVRIMPKNATMTTYTYIPGYGKTSETDTNGVTIYYKYNEWGYLSQILDNDRKPVKYYNYLFK